MGRFKFLTKKLTSYSRESFDDIYEVKWDSHSNKPVILNPNNQSEFKLMDFAQKYYLFLIDQNRWEDKKDILVPSNKEIDKLNVVVDKLKEGICIFALDTDGTIKGFCRYSVNVNDESVFIEELFTAMEYQRQGIADELLHYVEKKAIVDYRCTLMMNSVHSKNLGAIAFYNHFGLIEPKDMMFSVTPEYSTYVYQEIADMWQKKFIFSDGVNSDPVKWYGYLKSHNGHGNCPDYGMYVAQVAKMHKAKCVVTKIGLGIITPTRQQTYCHIIPIYYEDGNWVLVNYVGVDGPSTIRTFAGPDDLETVTKFINNYVLEWLPMLGDHVHMDYNKSTKIIQIASAEHVAETLEKYENKDVSQDEVLNFLFTDPNSKEDYDMENIKMRSVEQYSPRKKKYRTNNKNQVVSNRKYKCYDCGQRFQSYEWLVNHAQKCHADLIGDEDIHKYLYEKRNPGPHLCTICKTNPCTWNAEKRKYDRFCENPECRKKARELFRKNMTRVYGKDTLLDDPEQQAKMLANRSITTVYKLKDGTPLTCVGKFEADFAKHCDEIGLTGLDVMNAPSSIYVTYYNTFTQKNSYYIPDFYMPQLNLAIEIKDGSKYPIDSKAKVLMKEAAVKKEDKFNYIKIVDKDYSDFDDLIKVLAEKSLADVKKDTNHIFIIPESNEVL